MGGRHKRAQGWTRPTVTVQVVCAMVASFMPQMLFAAMSPVIGAEIHIGADDLGSIFATGNLSMLVGTMLSTRISVFNAFTRMRACVAASAAVDVLLALTAHSPAAVLVLLVLGGFAAGVVGIAGTDLLAANVDRGRQGWSFGLKQSAVPMSSALAGLAVPVVALTVGWRETYAIAALPIVLLVPCIGTTTESQVAAAKRLEALPSSAQLVTRRSRLLLGAGLGVGVLAATVGPLYVAATAAAAGYSDGFAGIVVGVASASALVARLVAGRVADRRDGQHLRTVIRMILVGSLGFGALALSEQHVLLLMLGAVVALGSGWAWTGVLILAVVRLHPHDSRAAGRLMADYAAPGSFIGPLLFGLLAAVSYTLAWATFMGLLLFSATLILLARWNIKRSQVLLSRSESDAHPAIRAQTVSPGDGGG
jgi:MFS family permease